MSNSSINVTASQSVSCNDNLVKAVFVGIDKFETPLYFIVGFFSRLISLAAIYRESKTEKAYFYQIYVLSAEAIEVLFYFLSQLARSFTQAHRTNAIWFQSCYACMWWSARLSTMLASATKTNTNLLTLVMTVDRAYSVLRPTRYPHLPHATIRKVVPFVVPFVSILVALPASFIFGLVESPNGLYLQTVAFLQYGFTYTFFTNLSVAFDVALLASNILANILMCYGFRKAMKGRAPVRDDANLDDQWKTLFKMTLCQSSCNTLALLSENAFRMFNSFVTSTSGTLFYIFTCLLAPFTTALVELLDILEFCLIMALSKKFRSMWIGTVKRMFGWKKNQVQVIQVR